MEYRRLGHSGLKVSAFSFGAGTFGGGNEFFRAWGDTGVEEARRLVDVCLDAGVNLFDTADVYSNGLSEEVLGKAVSGKRSQLLISTKATFRMGEGPNNLGSSRLHLVASLEGSLRALAPTTWTFTTCTASMRRRRWRRHSTPSTASSGAAKCGISPAPIFPAGT